MFVVKQIKDHVWKAQYQSAFFSIKEVTTPHVKKLVEIHHYFQSISYPYVLPILKVENNQITQPWFDGHSLRYEEAKDRVLTYKVLKSIHKVTDHMQFSHVPYFSSLDCIKKWSNRKEKWDAVKRDLADILDFEQINFIDQAIELFFQSIYPMANETITLLHGDVAHHNFLKNDQQVVIIDFDLAVLGPSELEWIHWLHRILPQVQYDLFEIEQQFSAIREMPAEWFLFLLYPNELLREWIYLHSLKNVPAKRKKQLVLQTSQYIENYEQLVHQILFKQ